MGVGSTDVKEAAARAVVARYPVGAEVGVYVNPADPREAALEPGDVGGFTRLYAFAAVFVVIGIVVAGTAMGGGEPPAPPPGTQPAPAGEHAPSEPAPSEQPANE